MKNCTPQFISRRDYLYCGVLIRMYSFMETSDLKERGINLLFVTYLSDIKKGYKSSVNTNRYLSRLRKGEKHEKNKHSSTLIAARISNSTITNFSVCE